MSVLNRMFVAAAAITAVSFVGANAPVEAQKPPQQEQKQQEEAKKQQAKPPPKQEQKKQEATKQQQQQRTHQSAQRLPPQQQRQLIGRQQERLVQYRDQMDQQQRAAPQQAAQLQRQHRTAQYGVQQQYMARIRDQRVSIEIDRNYHYGGDPYFYTPPSYRYYRGGHYYQTNEYGAAVLRQAVNYGYGEGFEAGRADRSDRWAFNYRDSYAYVDGNYGYRGFYIERDDYNHYFREGFRRGYDDGYYGRYQYGVYATGRYSVRGPVLSVILNLQLLR